MKMANLSNLAFNWPQLEIVTVTFMFLQDFFSLERNNKFHHCVRVTVTFLKVRLMLNIPQFYLFYQEKDKINNSLNFCSPSHLFYN